MNSALQCLSATKPLTDYFLSEMYKKDINRNNPLGMGGEIAERYGELLRSIWNGRYMSISPSRFKSALGRFAPQFSGYQQHDSQEFLAFLLDGLHEDLNRVKRGGNSSSSGGVNGNGNNSGVKQLSRSISTNSLAGGGLNSTNNNIGIGSTEQSGEERMANEAWQGYKLRNQSVVVDLFQGQFRSSVRCPCGHVSVTFDPFMYLSCPVTASVEERVVVLTLARRDPVSYHTRFALKVSVRGNILELKQQLALRARNILVQDMYLVEVYKHRVRRSLHDKKPIATINDGDVLYVFEIPSVHYFTSPPPSPSPSSFLQSSTPSSSPSTDRPPHHPLLRQTPSLAQHPGVLLLRLVHVDGGGSHEPFGHPLVLPISNVKPTNHQLFSECNKIIRQRILVQVSPSSSFSSSSPFSLLGNDEEKEEEDSVPRYVGEDGEKHPYYVLGSMEEGRLCPLTNDNNEANLEDRDAILISWAPPVLEAATRLLVGNSSGSGSSSSSDSGSSATVHQQKKGFPSPGFSFSTSKLSYRSVERIMRKRTEFRFEPEVEMDESVVELMQWERNRAHLRQRLTLQECLRLFTAPEKLSSENAWYCSHCRSCTEATKQLSIWFFPHILVIHLKRFEYNRYFREKLDVDVEFPLQNLDLSQFEQHRPPPAPWPSVPQQPQPSSSSPNTTPSSPPSEEDQSLINNSAPVYDLFAVSCHSGGLGCGHYTAYAKHGLKWYQFNDSVVSPVPESSVKGPEAYLLFYRRKTRRRNGIVSSSSSSVPLSTTSPSSQSISPSLSFSLSHSASSPSLYSLDGGTPRRS
jgi:ubiquitin carboxyl-terminal hydrolase 4/11/15